MSTKKKAPKASKDHQWVKDTVEKLKPMMFLGHWDIILKFEEKDDDSNPIYAEAISHTKYYEATLKFYPRFFEKDKDTRVNIIVHELCHVVLSSMKKHIEGGQSGYLVTPEEISTINEQTTTHFERIICSLMDKGAFKAI